MVSWEMSSLSRGGGGGGGAHFFAVLSQFSAIGRQLPPARPPRVLVGALCVPRAEILLLLAAGGLVTAPHFFRYSSTILLQFSRNLAQFFATGFDAP